MSRSKISNFATKWVLKPSLKLLSTKIKIKKQKELDKYLRAYARHVSVSKFQIEPSADFAERTLEKIKVIERHQKIISNTTMAVLILGPFLIRQLWLFVRADYFSATRLPFHEIIIVLYAFFLSSLAAYLLFGGGMVGVFFYFFGSRFTPKLRSIFQIFSLPRLKI